MFIKVRDKDGAEALVNIRQIQYITAGRWDKEYGSTIVMGYGCNVLTHSTIDEIEQMIAKSEDTE